MKTKAGLAEVLNIRQTDKNPFWFPSQINTRKTNKQKNGLSTASLLIAINLENVQCKVWQIL